MEWLVSNHATIGQCEWHHPTTQQVQSLWYINPIMSSSTLTLATPAHHVFHKARGYSTRQKHYCWQPRCGMCVHSQTMKQALILLFLKVFSKTWCPFSQKAKKFLNDSNIPYHPIEIDLRQDGADIQQALFDLTGQKTVPNIFIDKTHIGGYVDLRKAFQSKKFLDATLLEEIRSSSNTSSSL